MTADTPSAPPGFAPPPVSITGFFSLAAVSGTTIGCANIVTQLFAISIGATPFQLGVIGAMESTGMMLLTVPAGFIIARHGAKAVYALASLGPFLLYALMPWVSAWWALAMVRLAIGTCIPFRTVSMTSAFIGQLSRIGHNKAGWYRAFFSGGMAVAGPALATALTGNFSFLTAYLVIAASFAFMSVFSLSFFPEREKAAPIAEPSHDRPVAGTPNTGAVSQLTGLLKNPVVAESCAIEFLSGATGALYSTFILLVAGSLPGLTSRDGVTVILIDGLVAIACLFYGPRLFGKLSRRQTYLLGLTLAVSALSIAACASDLSLLIVGGMMLAVASAMVHIVNMVLLSKLPGEKSKASGLYQLASMVGAATGALSGGVLSQTFGINWLFASWMPVLLLTAIPIALLARRARPTHFEPLHSASGEAHGA